jgi:hypothetical protein
MSAFRDFDHRRFASWDEYRALAQALDDFLQRLEHEDDHEVKQPELERLLADMSLHMCASDCCPRCVDEHSDSRAWLPVVGSVERGCLDAYYVCDRGHRWQCGWGAREVVGMLP